MQITIFIGFWIFIDTFWVEDNCMVSTHFLSDHWLDISSASPISNKNCAYKQKKSVFRNWSASFSNQSYLAYLNNYMHLMHNCLKKSLGSSQLEHTLVDKRLDKYCYTLSVHWRNQQLQRSKVRVSGNAFLSFSS